MSNVEISRRQWTVIEYSIPSPGVAGDIAAAYTMAARGWRIGHPEHTEATVIPDDAFRVEARDDRIVFVVSESKEV